MDAIWIILGLLLVIGLVDRILAATADARYPEGRSADAGRKKSVHFTYRPLWKSGWLRIALFIAAILGAWSVMARQNTEYWNPGHMIGYPGWGSFMTVFMVFFWGLVALGAVGLIWTLTRKVESNSVSK